MTWPERLGGLRVRMALILGAALLVPFAFAVYEATSAYLDARARLTTSLQQTARLIGERQAEYFDKVRILLIKLAEDPALARAGSSCEAVLQRELDREPQSRHFGNFAIVDEIGQVRCTTNPQLRGRSLRDRSWFRDTRRSMDFTVSDVLVGRGLGVRTIVVAHPLRDASGAFAGAASVSLDLDALNAEITHPIEERAVVFLVDRSGQPVTQGVLDLDGSDPRLPTLDLLQSLVDLAGTSARAAVPFDTNGPDLAFIAVPVRNTPLHVVVGLPDLQGWTWLEHELLEQVLAATLMLAIALLAIWLATDVLITRYVKALARTARAYADGDPVASGAVAGAPRELRDLGFALERMTRDVREREQALEAALAHKDLLLREIHHRVKNNLQIVVSLLNLRTQAIHAPKVRRAMLEAQASIKALALVHSSLYEHEEGERVHLDTLLPSLCALLPETVLARPGNVQVQVAIDPVEVSVDRVIPLSLLITECITNSLKHAFPGGRAGTIEVVLRVDHGRAILDIRDDGVGFRAGEDEGETARPEPVSGSRDAGIGLTLIRLLAKQLGGEVSVDGSSGTRVRLVFVP